MSGRRSPLAILMLAIIRLYQLTLSPLVGRHCRFQPTCSCYAAEAIELHGAFRGGAMAAWRIARCQPWGGAGWDPVPHEHSTEDTEL
jgi:putative membrane protein insertion efficiency factor